MPDVSLKGKLIGVSVLLLGLWTVATVLSLGGDASHALVLGLLGIGWVVGGAATLAIVRHISTGTRQVVSRIDAIDAAAKANLMRGLEALAAGDLTVELHAATASADEFDRDEFGTILDHAEQTRDAMVACYAAYNKNAQRLRDLVGHMSSTAETVSSASAQMSETSEEAGKATNEIAQAIEDVAHGAERQVSVIDIARRAAEEVAAAVSQTAQQAEQAAEVAGQARHTAQHGLAAAEQADSAMRSVRDSSQGVSDAIRELASKSEQIGEIQTDTVAAVDVVAGGARKTTDGAVVVEQTREAFRSIDRAVQDMSGRVEQIAAAAQQITAAASTMQESIGEAARVAEESSASTQQVSASTQETSASSQEVAASAVEMASNADALRALVATFQLGLEHRG